MNLDRRTVKEVMRPRAKMAAIPDDLTLDEMIAAARKAPGGCRCMTKRRIRLWAS